VAERITRDSRLRFPPELRHADDLCKRLATVPPVRDLGCDRRTGPGQGSLRCSYEASLRRLADG
jgi:hypothetical protein